LRINTFTSHRPIDSFPEICSLPRIFDPLSASSATPFDWCRAQSQYWCLVAEEAIRSFLSPRILVVFWGDYPANPSHLPGQEVGESPFCNQGQSGQNVVRSQSAHPLSEETAPLTPLQIKPLQRRGSSSEITPRVAPPLKIQESASAVAENCEVGPPRTVLSHRPAAKAPEIPADNRPTVAPLPGGESPQQGTTAARLDHAEPLPLENELLCPADEVLQLTPPEKFSQDPAQPESYVVPQPAEGQPGVIQLHIEIIQVQ